MKPRSSATPAPVERPTPTWDTPVVNPDAICDECGASGAFAFDGVTLCVRCYAEKGSCCPEFGKDDLWADRVATNTGAAER